MRLTNQQKNQYQESGFVIVSGLFDPGTAKQMIAHYMTLRAEGSKPGDFGGTADKPDDPTHKYPRMINMHDWDELSKGWAMQVELLSVAEQLINDKPVLRQTMIYFKPPGGRGRHSTKISNTSPSIRSLVCGLRWINLTVQWAK